MEEDENRMLPANRSQQAMEYAQYDDINITISFMYLGIIMLPSILLNGFLCTAITMYKPYPAPHNVLIAHTLVNKVICAITRGVSFVFTIMEILTNTKPWFSCQFTDAFIRLLVMLAHTNLAALIFITFYGVSRGMQRLSLKHGTRLIIIQWVYCLTWITLYHFILGPDIMKERASRCKFHVSHIEIEGFVLAVFTGLVTVLASALMVVIFSVLTRFKVNNNLQPLDEETDALTKSIQKYTLWNGIVFALLAIPTTIFYWIAPLFINVDDTGAAILPRAVSYTVMEFVTQIVLDAYLITDAINILLMFKKVKMANKKLLNLAVKNAYKAWQMRIKFYPKSNRVAPIAQKISTARLDERPEGSESEVLNE